MHWDEVIERNREALKRVLTALVGMAGIAVGPHYEMRGEGEPRRTLARHLHRAVLRLLRPAESAVRRLVVVAARGLVVELPEPRPRKPTPGPTAGHAVLRSLGIAVVMSAADIAHAAADRRAAARQTVARATRVPPFPLLDPLRIATPGRHRTVSPNAAPRIRSFDGGTPHRLPTPGDPIDATRLCRRLAALGSALDDLPAHARRFARWQARRARALAQGRRHRLSPLKPGRAPGSRRRPTHEVHEILKDMQHFAREALGRPDTS